MRIQYAVIIADDERHAAALDIARFPCLERERRPLRSVAVVDCVRLCEFLRIAHRGRPTPSVDRDVPEEYGDVQE